MTIYIDLIILSNFIINLLFLYFVEKSFGDEIKTFRLIVASIFASLLILLYFIDYVFTFIFKIIGGALIVMIGLRKITKAKQIIKISLFYALNFAFVGFLQSFQINEWYLLILSIIVILGLFIFETNKKYFIFIKSCQYNVIVNFNQYILKLDAFLDTGNECFYNDKPVVFVNQKYQPKSLISQDIMSIETVSGMNYEYCFKPTGFFIIIDKKEYKKDVFIVFTNMEKDCLLNPHILI